MDTTPDNPYRSPDSNPPLRSKGSSTLASIKSAKVKKLRNNSHTIRAIAFLASLGALVSIYGYLKVDPSLQIQPFGILVECRLLFLIAIALNLIGAITLFIRKEWTKPVGIIYCSLLILSLSIFTVIIGVLGIIALSNSQRLLGKNRITHTEIDKEYKIRKKEGRI